MEKKHLFNLRKLKIFNDDKAQSTKLSNLSLNKIFKTEHILFSDVIVNSSLIIFKIEAN